MSFDNLKVADVEVALPIPNLVDNLKDLLPSTHVKLSLAPSIVGAAIKVIDLLSETTNLRDRLEENTSYFREKMNEAGFDIPKGIHPIVPVMLYDANLAQKMSNKLLEEGIYVIGFFFPVVPREKARIRVQISASHSKADLDTAIQSFIKVGKNLNVIN